MLNLPSLETNLISFKAACIFLAVGLAVTADPEQQDRIDECFFGAIGSGRPASPERVVRTFFAPEIGAVCAVVGARPG